MKYTILGFQQQKLIDNNLNVEDAFILRTIKDMYGSASMEFKNINGTKYMWINYTYLLEQIPIVGSKRNLMRKIEKYGKQSLILRVLKNERNGVRGNFSYIAVGPKMDTLEDFQFIHDYTKAYDMKASTLCTDSTRVMPVTHNKDTSIKDTSIKDNNILSFNNDCICETNDNNSNKEPKDNYIVEKEIFDYWNSKLGTIHSQERSFTKDKTKIKTAIKTYGKDEIMTAIDRLDKAVLDTNYYYSFKWNIFKFLKQSNGITNWLDDGQLWNSYNANKEVLTTNNKSNVNQAEIDAFLKGDF